MERAMNASAFGSAVSASARQVWLPDDARALSTLARIDYHDAFRVDSVIEHSAEQWARAVLEAPPLAVRARLVVGWTALGLRLGAPWSDQRVLGWKIARRTPSHMLLSARSWLGLRGELLFRSEPDGLLFATFIALRNPAARALWTAITPSHQATVRSLITHAARRDTGSERGQPAPAMYASSQGER
jgi:Protein of unknown function (DUF2867)